MKSSVKSKIDRRLECNFRGLAVRVFAGCGHCGSNSEPNSAAKWNSLKLSTLADIEKIVDRNERELHEELFDFALEVVCQYGYVVGDGLYATGGSSVIESAFSILRRYGMLDKDGYCSIANQPTINENNRGENDEK